MAKLIFMLKQWEGGFYAVTKLIYIHQTTNFYAMSVPKIFLSILTIDYMNLIVHHLLFFKFQILEKTRSSPCFYTCGLYVLCIVPMFTHPNIGKHDAGGGNHGYVRWNVHLVERFLHGNKINFYSFDHQFLCNVDAKNFSAHLDQ